MSAINFERNTLKNEPKQAEFLRSLKNPSDELYQCTILKKI